MSRGTKRPVPRRPTGWGSLALVILILLAAPAPSRSSSEGKGAEPQQLQTAARLIEESRPEEAVKILDKLVKRHPKNAKAFLLRSTAQFMLDNLDQGKRDLERSIELDPTNRQAWLYRAAIDLAAESYSSALRAFLRAEQLDSSAADNSLNIGAALLLLDRFDEARDRFKDYLRRSPGDAQARYLVASNYAMRGFAQPALYNLRRAIALDEKVRRRARTDPNFTPLESSPAYQEVLRTDAFRHAQGAMVLTENYDHPYLGGQSALLDAVIGSLQLAGRSFDPEVEVTPSWALVWSDLRIKVADNGAGGSLLEMSAPARRFSPGQWQAMTQQLLRDIKVQLHTRNR